jgi:hypothetical protein
VKDGVHEHGEGHFLGVRVAGVLRDAEDHHAPAHADLRRGEARPVLGGHRVLHVGEERLELRAERRHRLGDLREHRMPHPQDLTDGHGEPPLFR